MRYKRETLMDMTRPLKDWLHAHKTNPYPTKEQKLELCKESNMTMTQICNWFANARRRLKHTGSKDDSGELLGSDFNGHRSHKDLEDDSAWESGNEEESGRTHILSHDAINQLSASIPDSTGLLLQEPPSVKPEANGLPPNGLPPNGLPPNGLPPNGLQSVSPEVAAALSQTPLATLQNLTSVLYQNLATNNPAFNPTANLPQNLPQNPLLTAAATLFPFPINSSDKVNLTSLAQQYQLYQQYIGLLANPGHYLSNMTSCASGSTLNTQVAVTANNVKTEPVVISYKDAINGPVATVPAQPASIKEPQLVKADSTVKSDNSLDSLNAKTEVIPKYKNNLLARYLGGNSDTVEQKLPTVSSILGKTAETGNQPYPLDLTQTRKRLSSGSWGSRDSESISEGDDLGSCGLGSPKLLLPSNGLTSDSPGYQLTPSSSPGSDDISPIEQMLANLERSLKEHQQFMGNSPDGDNDLAVKEVSAILTLAGMRIQRTKNGNREH